MSDEATETPALTDLKNESMRFYRNVQIEAARERESVCESAKLNALTYIIFLSFVARVD